MVYALGKESELSYENAYVDVSCGSTIRTTPHHSAFHPATSHLHFPLSASKK